MAEVEKKFIKKIPASFLLHYFLGKKSLFRHHQEMFLQEYGPRFKGELIDIGGEKHYHVERFLPHVTRYVCTNIDRDYDEYQDATQLTYADNSRDNIMCLSVLQHIYESEKALKEIDRVLKPGGKLLIINAFLHPYCDKFDYYRWTDTFYAKRLEDYGRVEIVQFGGKYGAVANTLQRPKGKLTLRTFFPKLLGFTSALLGKFLEQQDGFPMGYGVYAEKALN